MYLARNAAPCRPDVTLAEHMVDVRARAAGNRDGLAGEVAELARASTNDGGTGRSERAAATRGEGNVSAPTSAETADFATPIPYQIRLVTQQQLVALWRSPDGMWNQLGIHIPNSLFAGAAPSG